MGTRAFAWMLLAVATPAGAQSYDENPSGRALFILGDLRATAADGERAWLDGGFGKGRYGRDGDARFRLRAAEGDIVWQPRLSWSLDATIAATAQDRQDKAIDLSEAYVRYRPDPLGALRLSGRVGLLWPPVSLEHAGPAWTVTETISPSAINSWIGEEVKPIAAEANASLPAGNGRIHATAALFGWNDTAGTLLSFRGWALHDQKATAFSLQPLPPLNAFMIYAQAARTRPVIELDDRPGFYGKLGWSSPGLAVAAFYYDNRGDPEAVDSDLQWGWRTRFANLSLQWKPDAATTVSSQAMTGNTRMGFPSNGRIWVDTNFRSLFLLATRRLDPATSVSARIEAFGTRGRGSELGVESSENGWAATIAGRHAIGSHLTLLAEALHIASDREERARTGVQPRQRQTVVQLAARVTL